MAIGLPLDQIFAYMAGARFTTLNANPTVFTGPAYNLTAGNGTAVGTVALTVPDMASGQYMVVVSCHTADRYMDIIDTSNTVKGTIIRDNAALAEGLVSAFFFMRTASV